MLKGVIPGPEQFTKKAIMAAIAVPEGIIMLVIAVFLDLAGLVLFVLDFAGVGIALSFLPDVMGASSIVPWVTTRSFFRGVIEKPISDISEKTLNVGGGLEGSKQFQGQGSSVPVQAGKKVAKTGIKLGLSVIRSIIAIIVELIPFLGDISPSWTILVISELVTGEL